MTQKLTVGIPPHILKASDDVSHAAMASNHNNCKTKKFNIVLEPTAVIAKCFYCGVQVASVPLPTSEEELNKLTKGAQ